MYECFNRVWNLINIIKSAENSPLVGYAFRFVLIEYSKPYNVPCGANKSRRKLDTSYIPSNLLGTHLRLIESRNKIHAHSDLTVMEVKLYVNEIRGERSVAIISNLITGVEELSNIAEIQVLVKRTLDNMDLKVKSLDESIFLCESSWLT